MHNRLLSTTLAIAALIAAGCSDGTQEQSPGEVLARDSVLASELRQADTSATPRTSPAPATGAPMRPVPATIHPEPLPTLRLPATPPRPASPMTRGDSSAAEILARIPGAAPPFTASDPCASPATDDQRRCLMLHLARSDDAFDRTYQALIAQMRREAGTPPGGPEPESVRQLRVAQRAWLVRRDTECRNRNGDKEGALWAPVRAQCLGEFSGARAAELARELRDR